MVATAPNNLYSQVVEVTQSYLGPASERFIARQIETHLNKKPEELTPEDLAKLVDWVKIAVALLTEDGKTVEAFTQSLLALSKKTA
ncbi:MAG TPA: hypothetical protein VNA68_02285 [Candidatus Dormibacteraeota bacterium]|nr:hypothetical protein [Candidatus Dormibacteraeota bacterium]